MEVDNLVWFDWSPELKISKVEFFRQFDPSCQCMCKCDSCGFYYLNSEGGLLHTDENGEFIKDDTPLCGVW